MGLGKMLKIAVTAKIKCDKCGAVIYDGTNRISVYDKYPGRSRPMDTSPGWQEETTREGVVFS